MRNIILVVGMALIAPGCGYQPKVTPGAPDETVKAADGVKWIAASVNKGNDASTWGQRTYPISTQERLLVHYQGLAKLAESVNTTKPVYMRVQIPDAAQGPAAKAALRVCPINRSWSMLAGWKFAAPFPGEEWPDGGDIEESECVLADNTDAVKTITHCQEADSLCFDLTNWFKRYLVEKGVDFGVAITNPTAGSSVRIYGDGSNSRGPRYHWTGK